MRKIYLSGLLFLLCFGGFAQNSHHITQSQARLIESQFGVVTAPIIGELGEISSVKIVDSVEFNIGIFKDAMKEIIPNLEDYKRYTIANYCQKSGYDLIINSLFQIRTNDEGDKLKVIVSGFPAKYKNFRQATADDAWMMVFLNKTIINP